MQLQPPSTDALGTEIRQLHSKLAAATLDAHTAWARYKGANSSRLTTEAQLAACNAEKHALEQKLTEALELKRYSAQAQVIPLSGVDNTPEVGRPLSSSMESQ